DDALALDVERHPVGGLLNGAGDHAPFDAEAAVAQLLALGHGLVGRAEVQRGVVEAAHDEEAEGCEHDEADDDQAAPTLGATSDLPLGYDHRGSRSSEGSSLAIARLLATIHAAYAASTAKVAP